VLKLVSEDRELSSVREPRVAQHLVDVAVRTRTICLLSEEGEFVGRHLPGAGARLDRHRSRLPRLVDALENMQDRVVAVAQPRVRESETPPSSDLRSHVRIIEASHQAIMRETQNCAS
jgi:hypothetical protein